MDKEKTLFDGEEVEKDIEKAKEEYERLLKQSENNQEK